MHTPDWSGRRSAQPRSPPSQLTPQSPPRWRWRPWDCCSSEPIASRRLMRIGVPKETAEGERRVALVPEVVKKLAGQDQEVLVERGAGAGALIPDAQYEDAGGKLVDDAWDAEVIVKVAPPGTDEVARLRSDTVLIGFLQ